MAVFYRLSPDGKDKYASFNKRNPTVIVDSVGIYYIVQDRDVEKNAKIYIKKKDMRNNNASHFN